jgi:release factor glutamine methyltransferase
MTIKEALPWAIKKLENKTIDNPDLEAGILLSAVTKKTREYIISHPDETLSFREVFVFKNMVNKRLSGYSSAVIIGHKWFYGFDFLVNKKVLIPRPETELMVEKVIQEVRSRKSEIKNLIDIGTGTGCIIISLVKNLPKEDIKFYGLDISKKALIIARKNAKQNNVDSCINFLYSDLLNIIDKYIFDEPTIITANLPYLTLEQVKNSPTIQKEPRLALLAGADGLDCYRLLFKQINERKINSGLVIFCEIDETQKDSMAELIRQDFPSSNFELIKDLGGHYRLAIIKYFK